MTDRPIAPSGAWLTTQLRRAERHAERVEPLLAAAVQEVLDAAAQTAADRFAAHAVDYLTAAAPTPQSTMICVKPTAEQALALALDGGEAPDTLHVTLAYLGETTGGLGRLVDALRPYAMGCGPLTGVVGGVGAFSDMGNGHPIIALPDVVGLNELRAGLVGCLTDAGIAYADNHGFCPHITLAYEPTPRFMVEALGVPLTFNDLLIVRGDVEVVPLPLSAAPRYASTRFGQHTLPSGSTRCRVPTRDGYQCGWPAGHRGNHANALDRIHPEDLTAAASKPTKFDRIREVAEQHRPDGGYGETWYRDGIPDGNGGTTYSSGGTVFWTCADWSTGDEIDAAEKAFLAIDGVGAFDHDAEGYPTEWRLVYGGVGATASASLDGLTYRTSLVAAADPKWSAPALDEVLPADEVINNILARTRPVRDAAVAAAAKPILDKVGISYDVTNPLIRPLLDKTAVHVVGIEQTTRSEVARIITRSHDEGLSIPHTADAIRAGMTEANVARSTLIARTELVGAVNGASVAAVRAVEGATGVSYTKIWMTAPGAKDPRHETYDGLDGQSRTLDQPFDVGGEPLDHPGDPSGSPGEVCNCRCTMRYNDGTGEQEVGAEDLGAEPIGGGDAGGGGLAAIGDAVVGMVADSAPVTAIPASDAVATDRMIDGLRETAARRDTVPDEREIAKARTNWTGHLRGRVSTDTEARQKVQRAVDYNASSALHRAALTKYGEDTVIVTKPGKRLNTLLDSTETTLAKRLTGNRTTIIKDRAVRELDAMGTVRPDRAYTSQTGGTAATLRHEYAHQVYADMPLADRQSLEALFPIDSPTLGSDLSIYARTSSEEAFAEAYAAVTDPGFVPAAWAPWVRDFRTGLEKLLGPREAEATAVEAPAAPYVAAKGDTLADLTFYDPAKLYSNEYGDPTDAFHAATASPIDQGDPLLHAVTRERGFQGLPDVVTSAEIDARAAAGEQVLYRGVGEPKFAEMFKDGEYYSGLGIYGNGTYSAAGSDWALADKWQDAVRTATEYAGHESAAKGGVMRMTVRPEAKIVGLEQVQREADAFVDEKMARISEITDQQDAIARTLPPGTDPLTNVEYQRLNMEATNLRRTARDFGMDNGRFAAMRGYDIILVPEQNFHVILNRTAVRVQKEALTAEQLNMSAATFDRYQ